MENEPIRVLHIVPNMQAGGLETLIMNIYRNIDSIYLFDKHRDATITASLGYIPTIRHLL